MEDTSPTRSRRCREGDNEVYGPCNFLSKAVSGILKCLGFDDHYDESKPNSISDSNGNNDNNSSSCSKKEKDDKKNTSKPEQSGGGECETPQDGQPSYAPNLYPPSTMDPPNDPPTGNLAGGGRTPPRPGLRTGNPQTNSSSS